MSTRSRRSAAGAEAVLNPTMIQLYDTERLKRELQSRNLPTNGSKQVLADRLSDAVAGTTYTSEPPKPVKTPTTVKRGRKANVKVEPVDEPPGEAECSSSTKVIKTEAAEITQQLKNIKTEIIDYTIPEFALEKEKADETNAKPCEVEDLIPSPSPSPEKAASPVKKTNKRKTVAKSPKITPPSSSAIVQPKRQKLVKIEVKAEVPDEITEKKADAHESSDDDMPVLSKLPPKGHHATRSKQLVPANTILPPTNANLDSDVFTSGAESPSTSRPHTPAVTSDLVKGDTDWKPPTDDISEKKLVKDRKPAPEKQKSQDKRPGVVDKVKPKPIIKPITTAWAEKVAEFRRSSTSNVPPRALSVKVKMEPEETSKSVVSPSTRRPAEERKPTAHSTAVSKQNGGDLLEDILGGQSQLLNERRRKQEELEREEAAMDEKRKVLLEQMNAPRKVSSTPYLLPPPPPPPPKRRIVKEVSSIELTLPPPPPPPKKKKSEGYHKDLLPPPPPPPKPCKAESIPKKESVVAESTEVVICSASPKLDDRENSAAAISSINELPAEISPSFSESAATDSLLEPRNGKPEVNIIGEHEQFNDVVEQQPADTTDSITLGPIAPMDPSLTEVAVTSQVEEYTLSDHDAVNAQMGLVSNTISEEEEYDPFESSTLTVETLENFYVPSTLEGQQKLADESDDSDDDEDSDEDIEMEEEEAKEKENVAEEKSTEGERSSAGKDASTDDVLDNVDLLRRANAVLQSLNNPKTDIGEGGPQYTQMPLTEDLEYEPEEAEKPQPDYHGEPVPSDDDDYLFQMAAGLAKPKKKREVVIEEEKLPSDETIEPDYYNADLHIKGATDKNWIIEPENADGLALMWGGVRSNYGVRLPFRDVRNAPIGDEDEEVEAAAKDENNTNISNSHVLTFQIKITEYLSLKHLPFEETDPYDIRVGFSFRYSQNIIGEHPNSYCFTALGKKASNNLFTDYGEPFGLNDVITACLDLHTGSLRYWKNDTDLGIAFQNIKLGDGDAVYPHICTKNCVVAVNFGTFPGDENEWKTNDLWRFPSSLGRGDLERSVKAPESKSDCTVLMMVGLPGVGKTTWVRGYLRDHPTEQWTVIQAETILAAMRQNGVSRQRAHQGRWDMVMGLVGKVLQRNVLLAARRRRNYMLDMCNTSRDMRKKRLQLFEEFRRKCLVIIPSDDDMLDRQAKQARSDGTGMIPPEAILEMKAMMAIPAPDQEPIEDVHFIEPPIHRIQDAIEIVAKYNEEGRPWFQKKYRRRRQGGYQPFIPHIEPARKMAPVTVLPPLKISITDVPTQSSDLPRSGSFGSTLGSASSSASYSESYRTGSGVQMNQQFSYDIPPGAYSGDSSSPNVNGGSLSAPYKSTEQQVVDVPSSVMNAQFTHGSGANLTPLGPSLRMAMSHSGNLSSGSYVPQNVSAIPEQRTKDPQSAVHLEELYGYTEPQPPQTPVLSNTSSINEEDIELSAEEMQELRDSTRSNSNQNPVVQEAYLRAKMRALQFKKKEKMLATPNFITVVSSRVVTASESADGGCSLPSNGAANSSIDVTVMQPGLFGTSSPVAGGNISAYPGTPSSSQTPAFNHQLSVNVSTPVVGIDFSTPPPFVHGGNQQSPTMSYALLPPMNIPPPCLPHSPAFLNTSIPPPVPGSVPPNGFSPVTGSNWNSSR